MAKENHSRFIILGFLSHQPMSGYDIKKCIENSISNFWDVSFGQIYPELTRLENENLVIKDLEINEDSPNRKIYTITEKGIKELRQWLIKPINRKKINFEILLKIFFAKEIPESATINHLEDFIQHNTEKIDLMKAYENQLSNHLKESPDHLFYLLTVLYGKKFYQTQIDWAKEVSQIISQKNKGEIL